MRVPKKVDMMIYPKLSENPMWCRSAFQGCWAILFLTLVGCGRGGPPVAPPQPPVVTVEHPVIRPLDSLGEFTGRLDAIESQVVKAQVTGYLRSIHFKDGTVLQPGDVLYEIDPEPYQAALANAKALVAKSTSDVATLQQQLTLATRSYERSESLLATKSISQQEFDEVKTNFNTAGTTLNAATSTLEANRAQVRKAEFDLTNCTIRSAVSVPARVSRTEITVGNLVVSGQTTLCKITSLDPIFAYWDVDEETSLQYRRRVFDEKSLPDPRGEQKLAFWVGSRDEEKGADGKWPHDGFVDYVAPEIVRGSGTREIRGVLSNPGYRLTPGDSVRVQVVAGPNEKLLTVPEIAIGSQQQQKFVYVIQEKEGKSIAEFRPVTLGPTREVSGVRLQVIHSGLSEQELVVVNGLLRVRPGAEVKATVQSSPVSPSAN